MGAAAEAHRATHDAPPAAALRHFCGPAERLLPASLRPACQRCTPAFGQLSIQNTRRSASWMRASSSNHEGMSGIQNCTQVVYARAWMAKKAPAASPPRAVEQAKAETQGLELLVATQGSEPALDAAAESSPDLAGTDHQNAVRGSGVRKTRASSWRRRRAAKQRAALGAAAAQGLALPAGKLVQGCQCFPTYDAFHSRAHGLL